MSFRTKNGVLPCGGKYNDGLALTVTSSLGKIKKVTVKSEKRVLLQETNANCRTKPYTELFNEKFLINLRKNCANFCQTKNTKWTNGIDGKCKGLILSEEFRNLSQCKEDKEERCFDDVMDMTLKSINGLPCTLLEHKTGLVSSVNGDKNRVGFHVRFDPPKQKVYEEYLILD